ncbi:unnamed protein product [Lupinus luteus]|uniref:Uncharacterized protein n=1 Tax=Lupinus luteus TaxID=3873 RepID=A0AAV1X5S1_LUPLU
MIRITPNSNYCLKGTKNVWNYFNIKTSFCQLDIPLFGELRVVDDGVELGLADCGDVGEGQGLLGSGATQDVGVGSLGVGGSVFGVLSRSLGGIGDSVAMQGGGVWDSGMESGSFGVVGESLGAGWVNSGYREIDVDVGVGFDVEGVIGEV